jgi:hypothetical protein
VNPTDVRREQVAHDHIEIQQPQRQEPASRIVTNDKEPSSLLAQLNDLEEHGGSGVLTFATGQTLSIDGLTKILWRGSDAVLHQSVPCVTAEDSGSSPHVPTLSPWRGGTS